MTNSPHPLQTLADQACHAFALADFRAAAQQFGALVRQLEHGSASVPAPLRYGLACSLAACGELQQSVAEIRQVPPDARQRLLADRDTDRAIATVLTVGWDAHQIQGLLCSFALRQGRWEYRQPLREALEALAVRRAGVPLHRSLVFDAFAFGMDDRLIAALTARFAADHAGTPASVARVPHATAGPSGPIRVAALSGEFRRHPTCLLVVDLMAALDRRKVHLTGVYLGDTTDRHTRKAQAACDAWVHLPGQDAHAVADALRALHIDVLWALGTFQQTPVAEVLALRPAPLVINAIASTYPHGRALVDYAVVDPYVLPEHLRGDWPEAVIQWPSSPFVMGQVLDEVTPAPERSALGLPDDALVMAAFHRGYKFSPECAAMWSAILHRCPRAVLWRCRFDDLQEASWQHALRSHGIDAEKREVIAEELPWSRHLARLGRADLFLDSTPTAGHTTLLEALARGVPAVTMTHAGPASRIGLALLHSVGLEQGITGSPADYVERVVAWASDPALRARWRDTLSRHLPGRDPGAPAIPIFNPALQARWWEEAFETTWSRHRAGQAPQDVRIAGSGHTAPDAGA